jgi:hypothetical protein
VPTGGLLQRQGDTPNRIPLKWYPGGHEQNTNRKENTAYSMDSLEEQVSYLILHRRPKQPATRLVRHYALLSLFLRRCKKPLDRTRGEPPFLHLLLFCPLLAFRLLSLQTSSLPRSPTPKNAQQKKEEAQNNIEGYINSYIQNSKKGAKAKEKASGEGYQEGAHPFRRKTERGPAQLSYSSRGNRTAIPAYESSEVDNEMMSMYSLFKG